ncbi:MAG: family 78 glycoside hydrolase catalytic domain [Armatimonadetes bacterium]|nr:family 78 glycoside hydrolase catalytic domain [Armatimonadota bacterium]
MLRIADGSLRCNLLVDPLAIADERPILSWVLDGDVRQVAYRIVVSSRAGGEPDLWDSGRVESDQTFGIAYGGLPLQPLQVAFWRVMVCDGEWSTEAQWKRAPDGWCAEWIGWDEPIRQECSDLFLPPPRCLRTEFSVERPIQCATLYATALGIFETEINGRRVGQEWFAPGWTDYTKRVHYRAYDVTSLITKGENAIGATLMDGWYAGYLGFKPERDQYGDQTRFSCMLVLEYRDGEVERVVTSADWRASVGPLHHSDFLMGESLVECEQMDSWSSPGFDDSAWSAVDAGTDLQPLIEPYPMNPCVCFEVVKPVSVRRISSRKHIYDFGQNLSGVVVARLRKARATIRHGEALDSEGNLYTDNLRTAQAIDKFSVLEKGREYSPSGTFHGFRYAQATGAKLASIKAKALSNIDKLASTFECSDERLNRLWSNIVWTQRANFIEVPTDCPQRDERLGWTGDIQIYARTACLVADVQAFLRKWLVDLADAQRDDGQYPMVAPLKVAGDDGGPAWSDAGVIVPWALYQVYEDRAILDQQYESMKRFLQFCESRSTEEGLPPDEYHCFGDWLNVEVDTPHDVIYTAYFAHAADLMSRIAAVLECPQDEVKYHALFAKLRSSFARAYVSDEGVVAGDSQTGYALALAFGLLDEPLRSLAVEQLVVNVERHGHLTTGFVGTKDLMLVLRDIGRTDIAYTILLSDEYPGWLFSVKHGATTIWERWNGWTPEDGFADPAMNSLSHYAYGAVGQFMMETIGGIRLLEPGYKRVLIAPEPGPLTHGSATYDSVRGRITTDWRIADGQFTLKLSIPPSIEAVVRLPSGEEAIVGAGTWDYEEQDS